MVVDSSAELLVLHGVRILGMVDAATLARRFSLDRVVVQELLLDYQANGWVQQVGFADLSGWTLTRRGRDEGERMVAAELETSDARQSVSAAHSSFVELNSRFLGLVTKWQLRPIPGDPLAANDHSDWRWDTDVLKSLAGLGRRLRPVQDELSQALSRFDGYQARYVAALDRVDLGERKWVDEPKIDSCHTVWFELHEDLLATLGLERGSGT